MSDKYPTHGFDRSREQNQKGYDGDLVSHVLDYYLPEWEHKNGLQIQLAGGKTDDGRQIIIYINRDRTHVIRLEIDESENPHPVIGLGVSLPKASIKTLWRHGDTFNHEKSDRRFFQLLADMGA